MGRRKANQLKKFCRPDEFPREEAIGLRCRAVLFKVIAKQKPLMLANFVLGDNGSFISLVISLPLPLRRDANVDLEEYVKERYGPIPYNGHDDDICKTKLAKMYLEIRAPHLLPVLLDGSLSYSGKTSILNKTPGWWKGRALTEFEFSRESARGKTCVSVMHEVIQSLGPNIVKGFFVQVPPPNDHCGFSMTLVIREVVSSFNQQQSTPSLCCDKGGELYGPVTRVSKKACKRNLAFLFLQEKAPFLLPVTCDTWIEHTPDNSSSVGHQRNEIVQNHEEPLFKGTKDLKATEHHEPRNLMKEKEKNLLSLNKTIAKLEEVSNSDSIFLKSGFKEIYSALDSIEDELKKTRFY